MTAPVDLTADPTVMVADINGWLTTDPSVRFTDVAGVRPPAPRATLVTTLTAPEPVIYQGRPVMPRFLAQPPVTMRATTGATHIRGKNNPAPVWNPDTGTWTYPPGPAGVGTYRWTVASLPPPDMEPGGKYVLGARAGADETMSIPDEQVGWKVDKGSDVPSGPTWNSAYPFKPTVAKRWSVVDGRTIKHPVGVHFLSGDLAHMWLDMGASKPQPFTWIIVAMRLRRSSTRQTILDSGRNPYQVGVPQLTPAQLGDDRNVADGLGYRTSLSVASDTVNMNTDASGGLNVAGMTGLRPAMYTTVFNGASSALYVRDALRSKTAKGAVPTGAAYQHRYYVLGRAFGLLAEKRGMEMVVFEIRYWNRVLTEAEINSQYTELSSTYLFSKYKT